MSNYRGFNSLFKQMTYPAGEKHIDLCVRWSEVPASLDIEMACHSFDDLGVLLAVPVLVALFAAAFTLSQNSRQRMANLLLGALGAVALLAALVFYMESARDRWIEDRISVLAPLVMTVGALVGVAVSVLVRRFFSATR